MIKNDKPKVLYYDIENFATQGYFWGKIKQNILGVSVHSYMLSVAYKWEGEKKVHIKALTDYKDYKAGEANDYNLVKDFIEDAWSKADVVVAHNGDNFDQKVVRARAIANGLPPLNPVIEVDTLKMARRQFRFWSNSLNDLGNFLQLGVKVQTGGFGLWMGCHEGDKKAWKLMKEYNIQDVVLLEKVYKKLRPWSSTPLNMAAWGKPNACPKCGEEHTLIWRSKPKVSPSGLRYRRFSCKSCGGWSQSTVRDGESTTPKPNVKHA